MFPVQQTQLSVALPLAEGRAPLAALEKMLPQCPERDAAVRVLRALAGGGVLLSEDTVVLYADFLGSEQLHRVFPCLAVAARGAGGDAWLSEGVALSWRTPDPNPETAE